MRILLPKFNEMHVRIQTLTEAYRVDHVPELALDGADTLSNVILCLDVSESLAKLVPRFGALAECICGTVRKIISMTQCAKAVKEDCVSLVKHAATIALAVITEVSSAAGRIVVDSNLLELWSTVQDVERGIAALSKLRRYKYFLHRARISEEISELRTRLDNARMAFRIRSDLSTRHLLMDIRNLQRRLVARVEEKHSTQGIYHHETIEKLDFMVRAHASVASS
ncbi:hypothetical protein CPB85DRAFT_850794 [Mucidula mucida]|nr:hypothetical protein CPB85DRAFT_850794 [Mucidula mucida]